MADISLFYIFREDVITLPNKRLKKCGDEIKTREDCEEWFQSTIISYYKNIYNKKL